MLRWSLFLLAIIALVIVLRLARSPRREPGFWESFEDAGQVQREVEGNVPAGSSLATLYSYAASKQLGCGGRFERVVYCSAVARNKNRLVGRKWLIEIYLDSEEMVEKVVVKEGLTGP